MNYIKIKKQPSEKGSALVLVLSLSAILLLLGSISTRLVMDSQSNTVSVFAKHSQAANIAQAGLQDGLGWFKKNAPVRQDVGTDPCKDAAFKPNYDPSDPENHETDDAAVGLVKDIKIHRNIYGRYILKKQPCAGPDLPDTVKDISSKRGRNSTAGNLPNVQSGELVGDGNVWYLHSEGVVYRRADFSKTDGVFDTGPEESPNTILSRASAAVEISRLSVNVDPAPLTLFQDGGPGHVFNNNCKISGQDASGNALAAAYYYGNTPNVNGATLTPSSLGRISRPAVTTESVFAVQKEDLKGIADNLYTNVNQLPEQLTFSITYLDGNFTFTSTQPLFGGGLLYVDGNLTLNNSSNSLFSGVIFVNGTLNIGKDNALSGTIIAKRIVCNPGSGSANIEYNSSLITSVSQRLALYRENNLTHVIREIR